MSDAAQEHHHDVLRKARRYLIVGLLTIAPLWITWLVFHFVFGILSDLGRPSVITLGRALRPIAPSVSAWLLDTAFQAALGVLVTLALLCLIGWMTSHVLGQRLIALGENLLGRIPMVQKIYGGTKRFIAAMQAQPEGSQRVVLISFPSQDMKAVGFVSRVITDDVTGEKHAAVYVPTSPNPTSGYMEIVPLEHVIPTDWTIDEAMAFIVTGGANAPKHIRIGGAQASAEQVEAAVMGGQQRATQPPDATTRLGEGAHKVERTPARSNSQASNRD